MVTVFLLAMSVSFSYSLAGPNQDTNNLRNTSIEQEAAKNGTSSSNNQGTGSQDTKEQNKFLDQIDTILFIGIAILAIAGQRPLAFGLFILLLFKQFS
ncbi:MAG: hypothetical protein ABFS45_26400 [Pseudomonadota bacterium]